MHRRALLGTLAVSTVTAVAGCLEPTGPTRLSTTDLESEAVDPSFHRYERQWDLEVSEDATAVESMQVGSSDDSHEVVVLADSVTEATITIETNDGDDISETTLVGC